MSGTAPSEASEQDLNSGQPAAGAIPEQPGFGSRGKARRRARFLRRARELAYRDLGGLVYNLHRFGQRNDALVLGKLGTLSHIDNELRTIEGALRERRPVTVLREAGITACPRCAAIHGSEDRFCPNCGLPMARNVDLPIAGAPAGAAEPQAVVSLAAAPQQPQPQPGEPQAQPPQAQAEPPQAQAQLPQPQPQPPQAQPPQPQPQVQPAAQPPPPQPAATIGQAPPADAPGFGPPSTSSAPAEESTEILHPRTPGS